MTPGMEVVLHLQLEPWHKSTGKTRHYVGTVELPEPSALQIARFPDGAGFYLLYLNEHGDEVTDTYHDSIEDAKKQAEWEFGVRPDEWTATNIDLGAD